MENSPILRKEDLARLHSYLGRNVYERLYNTPTTSTKMGRSPFSNARGAPSRDVLIIPSPTSPSQKVTTIDRRLHQSFQTPKEFRRGQGDAFNSSNKKSIDNDPDLTELIQENKATVSDPLYKQNREIPSVELSRKSQSYSSEKVQKAQRLSVSHRQRTRVTNPRRISPDSVPAFSAALTPGTISQQKGNSGNMLKEERGTTTSAVKRQLFISETPTRSNRSVQITNCSTQQHISRKPDRPSRVTPNRLLQKLSPMEKDKLVSTQTKALGEISASAKKGLGNFFQDLRVEGISLDEMDKAIMKLYPDLDYNALALLAYRSLHSNREGLVDVSEFQQFVHFLAFFNDVWKDVVYCDKTFGLSVRRKDFVAISQKLGLFDNPMATFSELDTDGHGRILYDQFCTLCVSKKFHNNNGEGDNGVGKSTTPTSESTSTDHEETINEMQTGEGETSIDRLSLICEKLFLTPPSVNLLPVQDILDMFDSDYVPTWETALTLFYKIDVRFTGKLMFSEIVRGFDSLYATPASKPLALRVYLASELGKKEFLDPPSFYLFLLFLVYFNNLWDCFGFSRRKHFQISKRRYISAVANLGLFDSPEEDFAQMDKNGQGYITFEDFCIACARRRLDQATGQSSKKIIEQ